MEASPRQHSRRTSVHASTELVDGRFAAHWQGKGLRDHFNIMGTSRRASECTPRSLSNTHSMRSMTSHGMGLEGHIQETRDQEQPGHSLHRGPSIGSSPQYQHTVAVAKAQGQALRRTIDPEFSMAALSTGTLRKNSLAAVLESRIVAPPMERKITAKGKKHRRSAPPDLQHKVQVLPGEEFRSRCPTSHDLAVDIAPGGGLTLHPHQTKEERKIRDALVHDYKKSLDTKIKIYTRRCEETFDREKEMVHSRLDSSNSLSLISALLVGLSFSALTSEETMNVAVDVMKFQSATSNSTSEFEEQHDNDLGHVFVFAIISTFCLLLVTVCQTTLEHIIGNRIREDLLMCNKFLDATRLTRTIAYTTFFLSLPLFVVAVMAYVLMKLNPIPDARIYAPVLIGSVAGILLMFVMFSILQSAKSVARQDFAEHFFQIIERTALHSYGPGPHSC